MGRGRQAEVRAARQASILVLRPLDGRRDGRPEVDHAIHMIIDVGRSVGRASERRRLRSSFKIQQQSSGQQRWLQIGGRRGKEGGLAFHNVS